MTDREAFMDVVKASGLKFYEVASLLSMSPQSLYNKLGNTTEFTQLEMSTFREKLKVDPETFERIFFARE